MVLKKMCTTESHTRFMRLQQELTPQSVWGGGVERRRGVKHNLIILPISLIYQHPNGEFLKKGELEKFFSKIRILSKITVLSDI